MKRESAGIELARNSIGCFAYLLFRKLILSTHHQQILRALSAVERGKIRRLIITAPPRHSKSILTSEFFPCYCMGRDPSRQIIFATYGQDLSLDFGRKIKNHMLSDAFRQIFPQCSILQDSQASNRLNTSDRGAYVATSIGGSVTGKGANILIIDDPVKDREQAESKTYRDKTWDWYLAVARPRLQPDGSIIIISTRWHEDDLTGRVLKTDTDQEWTSLHFPAISDSGEALWPEYFPLVELQKIKRDIGSYDFEALYQGRPAPRTGGFLKAENINLYDELPYDRNGIPMINHCIISVDSANKTGTMNDYSVIAVWGKYQAHLYLIDLWRDRVEYPALKSKLLKMVSDWNPTITLIEDKASGTQVIQELRQSINLRPINPDRDKITRAIPLSATIEAGNLFIPQRAWTQDVIAELRSFPNGAHDDCVDAASMAHDYLSQTRAGINVAHPFR